MDWAKCFLVVKVHQAPQVSLAWSDCCCCCFGSEHSFFLCLEESLTLVNTTDLLQIESLGRTHLIQCSGVQRLAFVHTGQEEEGSFPQAFLAKGSSAVSLLSMETVNSDTFPQHKAWDAINKQANNKNTTPVQFSRSVVSDSLWPHEPQHARPPCPPPTPGIHPNPCRKSPLH